MIQDDREMDFIDIFEQPVDPLIEQKKLYPMPEILLTQCNN
jgi:hypothetical protein